MGTKSSDSDAELAAHNSPAEREKRRLAAKARFIEAVAEYLTTDVAMKSIHAEMGKASGKEWAKIANTLIGGNGYDNKAMRIEQLTWLLA